MSGAAASDGSRWRGIFPAALWLGSYEPQWLGADFGVRDMLRVMGAEEKVGRIDRFTSLAHAIDDFQEQAVVKT